MKLQKTPSDDMKDANNITKNWAGRQGTYQMKEIL